MRYKIYNSREPFSYIVLGFCLWLLAQLLLTIFGNQMLEAFVKSIGWYYILKGFLKCYSRKNPFKGFYKFVFVIYLLLCVIMIARGYMIDYSYQWVTMQGMINFHFFQIYYILPYLIPLVVFIPIEKYDFSWIIKNTEWLSLILLVIYILFFPKIIFSAQMEARGIGDESTHHFGTGFVLVFALMSFIVLFKKYTPTRIWWLYSIVLIMTLLIYAIAGRRGSSVTLSMLLFFNFYFFIKSRKKNRGIGYLILIGLVIGCIYLYFSSSLFDFIQQRGLEDTRSGVDESLLSQMSESELIYGKGLNGRYYYPLGMNDYLLGWRYGTETGFFNIVLKGGYLMALIYVYLLLIPALKGLFKSKNMFCKAGGFYILLSLWELYPFGWLSFSLKFLVIWMLIVCCQSKRIRRLNDEQIKAFFFRNIDS